MYRITKCDCFISSPQISETRDLQDPWIFYNNRRGPSTLEVGAEMGNRCKVDFYFPRFYATK